MTFEEFCNKNLGDAVVRDNGIPISKKIRNYETFWMMSPFFDSAEDFDDLKNSMDDSYDLFSIDRSKAYRLITAHRNPDLLKETK